MSGPGPWAGQFWTVPSCLPQWQGQKHSCWSWLVHEMNRFKTAFTEGWREGHDPWVTLNLCAKTLSWRSTPQWHRFAPLQIGWPKNQHLSTGRVGAVWGLGYMHTPNRCVYFEYLNPPNFGAWWWASHSVPTSDWRQSLGYQTAERHVIVWCYDVDHKARTYHTWIMNTSDRKNTESMARSQRLPGQLPRPSHAIPRLYVPLAPARWGETWAAHPNLPNLGPWDPFSDHTQILIPTPRKNNVDAKLLFHRACGWLWSLRFHGHCKSILPTLTAIIKTWNHANNCRQHYR